MKRIIVALTLLTISLPGPAEEIVQGKQKIIYKYKKYEKFDFEDLMIEGETGSPGDLSISPRMQMRFKNKLPYRKNFNAEIRNSVERVR